MAQREGEVFVLIGDGTYLMNPTELVTAVQEGLKITVVVSENHGYQCIRRLQMCDGRARASATSSDTATAHEPAGRRLRAIDFAARTPRASGARAWHVETRGRAASTALARPAPRPGPCVIVVEIEKHRVLPGGGVWWDVAPAEVSRQRRPASSGPSTSEGSARQRYYG